MKLAAFVRHGRPGLGQWMADGTVRPYRLGVEAAAGGVLAAIEAANADIALSLSGETLSPTDVELKAPMPKPRRNIFCVGKNYREHAREFASSGFDSSAVGSATDIPDAPIVFSKVPECVVGPQAPIVIDRAVSPAVDYEAELCVIVGRGGRGIRAADALDHVWGYTIVNDVTARDLQALHKQWLLGKSQDGFCPMGPVAVTADEIDLSDTRVRCWVDGELRQDANTRDMIFNVPMLIETISRGITLLPGDLIATGTPAGVGIGFKPPRYLVPGSRIRIEVDNIGVLENTVIDRSATATVHEVR